MCDSLSYIDREGAICMTVCVMQIDRGHDV